MIAFREGRVMKFNEWTMRQNSYFRDTKVRVEEFVPSAFDPREDGVRVRFVKGGDREYTVFFYCHRFDPSIPEPENKRRDK